MPAATLPEEALEDWPPPAEQAASAAEPAGAPRTARFAEGSSDVMELTELVEEVSAEPESGAELGWGSLEEMGAAVPEVQPAAEPAEPISRDEPPKESDSKPPPAESLGAMRIDYLFEATGGDTEISAHGGRLRLTIPFKVVQGVYTFYLEQRGPKQFSGFLVSPSGTRHKVDVDFTSIMDIKEIFDQVMLGR